jgi:hypothetical protein
MDETQEEIALAGEILTVTSPLTNLGSQPFSSLVLAQLFYL